MKPDQTRPIKRFRLPQLVERLIYAGTWQYRPDDRQGLVVANITGYLASLSSLNYAAFYASHNAAALKGLVAGNILSAFLTALVPFSHRFGRSAGALLLTVTIFSTIFYFISVLGHGSGIQLNYIGASAVALAILGRRRIGLGATIVATGVILHLLAWFMFPEPRAGLQLDPAFLHKIYTFSAISIMAIVFLVVFYAFHLVREAQAKTDALMRNIMPDAIADRLKEHPDQPIADNYDEASIIFADLTGFTPITQELGANRTINLLNDLFSSFDELAAKYDVEKIKTIGDAYMAAAGLPTPDPNHAENIARMAIEFIDAAKVVSRRHNADFNLRIGIASGPVLAGIIGKTKFSYDVWGETVNLAARLEPQGKPGEIIISDSLHSALEGKFDFKPAVYLDLKGIGKVTAWQLDTAIIAGKSD